MDNAVLPDARAREILLENMAAKPWDGKAGGDFWRCALVTTDEALAAMAAFAKEATSPASDAAAPKVVSDTQQGWVIGNGNGTKWRAWINGAAAWVESRAEATRYARRCDAEAVHAEDDDAWLVEPFSSELDDASMRASMERIADLSECWTDSLVSQINEIARQALTKAFASSMAEQGIHDALQLEFRNASRGTGRAGTAEMRDGPYMSMDDAAGVYADLMLSKAVSDVGEVFDLNGIKRLSRIHPVRAALHDAAHLQQNGEGVG